MEQWFVMNWKHGRFKFMSFKANEGGSRYSDDFELGTLSLLFD